MSKCFYCSCSIPEGKAVQVDGRNYHRDCAETAEGNRAVDVFERSVRKVAGAMGGFGHRVIRSKRGL